MMTEKPFRVGIWCDYGFTYVPDEGVGVVIYNLVQGFLALDESVEVVLLVKRGDQERVTSFTGRHERLRIVTRLDGKLPWRFRFAGLLKRLVGWLDRFAVPKETYWAGFDRRLDRARRTVVNALRSFVHRVISRNVPAMVGAAIVLPFLAILLWAAYAVFRYGMTTLQVLTYPGRLAARGVRYLSEMFPLDSMITNVVRQLECDAWIVPQVLLDHSLPFPSVVLIHDFASSHFQEQFERWYPGYHERARRLMPLRAREAALCVCMSTFIRDSDLLGALKLPASKVRVIRTAPPADLPELDVPAEDLKPNWLHRPYIFYPAAFRPYKNHGGLIEALGVLSDRYGADEWDLVFTGEKSGFLPAELRSLVHQAGLQGRVHVLGRVDRKMLSALYRCAFATVVPSFYEQGSFQIYEALQAGCPVACSRIPSFLEQCSSMGESMLYFDPADPDALARTILAIRDDRASIHERQSEARRLLWSRSWQDVARDFLQVCNEATPRHLPSRLEVLLFLQARFAGGVWESTKDLLRALVEINGERQKLTLTLGVHHNQTDTSCLEQLGSEFRFERFQLEEIAQEEAGWILRQGRTQAPSRLDQKYCFMKGCESAALRADAWLALSDRFARPLLPARTYGILVHDLIQRYLPQAFPPEFSKWMREGMTPSARNAQTVLVTSSATAADAVAEYQLDPSRVRLVPVACEPHRRFAHLEAEPVDLPRQPFILCVANSTEHKGADVLLRAYAQKKKTRANFPLLVFAGYRTEALSVHYRGEMDFRWWAKVQKLVQDLALVESQDMVFLGQVNDCQLLDLYQRCAVVVNAAKHDNGSFSLIEGAYFGRPVISSQYPAAEFLVQRFGISVQYFPIDDHQALALALERSLDEQPIRGEELERLREQLRDPELSYRRYAERVYDVLLDLAKQGRSERLTMPGSFVAEGPQHSAA
jgi:glycosyltransferase involved in cell wall biosynthesis